MNEAKYKTEYCVRPTVQTYNDHLSPLRLSGGLRRAPNVLFMIDTEVYKSMAIVRECFVTIYGD